LQARTFQFERNLLTYGDMDGGSLNRFVVGRLLYPLTTQQALLDRGYTRAIRWRTDGSATEFVGYTSAADLREAVGAYFLIYAENPADVAENARAQIFGLMVHLWLRSPTPLSAVSKP
jgi:hypothetical protein